MYCHNVIVTKRIPAGIVLLTGRFLFFVARSKVKFGREERTVVPAKFHFDPLMDVGLRPQNFKKWNFTNISPLKGRVPSTILAKFTELMCVLYQMWLFSLNK